MLPAKVIEARKKKGWSRNELAKRAGLAQPSLRAIEIGQTKEVKFDTISSIAAATGEDLSFFVGNVIADLSVVPAGVVPVVSWVQAGSKNSIVDPQPGAADEWEDVTVPHSRHTFALRVRGDSMVSESPDGPSFPENTIIIVDPEVEARNGDYVVVRFNNTDEATFKKLIVDGPNKLLKALNPTYPTIHVTEDARLAGVVIESNMRRKFR